MRTSECDIQEIRISSGLDWKEIFFTSIDTGSLAIWHNQNDDEYIIRG